MAPDASDKSGGLYGQGRPRGPLSFVGPPSEGLSGLPWWVVVDRFRPDRWEIAAAAVMHPWGRADHGMHREADPDDNRQARREQSGGATPRRSCDQPVAHGRTRLGLRERGGPESTRSTRIVPEGNPRLADGAQGDGNQGDNEQRRSIHVLDLLDFHMEPMSGDREV